MMRRLLLLGTVWFAVLGGVATASASAKLHDGDGCSYSPIYVGQTGSAADRPFSGVTDIREIIDDRSRTIGYVYSLQDGTFTLEGNALLPIAEQRKYGIFVGQIGSYWTGIVAIDPATIRERVIACRANRIQHSPVHGARVEHDAGIAYSSGRDFINDPYVR